MDFIAIKGLHANLCTPKITRVLVVRISGLPFGSPETKCHLDVAPVESAENTIKGKVVASPKSESW